MRFGSASHPQVAARSIHDRGQMLKEYDSLLTECDAEDATGLSAFDGGRPGLTEAADCRCKRP